MEPEGSLPHSQTAPSVPVLSQISLVHTSPFRFLKTHFNIILPPTLRYSKWFLSIKYLHQNPVCNSSGPIRATCPTYIIIFDMINRIIFGEQYRSLSSSLCSFLHSPVTSQVQIFSLASRGGQKM